MQLKQCGSPGRAFYQTKRTDGSETETILSRRLPLKRARLDILLTDVRGSSQREQKTNSQQYHIKKEGSLN